MYQAKIGDVDALHAVIPTPSGIVIMVDRRAFYPDYKFLIEDFSFYLQPGDDVTFDAVNETSDEPRAISISFPKSRLSDSEGWGIVETQTDAEATVWSPDVGTVLLLKETICGPVMGFSGTYFQEITKPGSRVLFEIGRRSADSNAFVAKRFRAFDCTNMEEMVRVFGPFEVQLPKSLSVAPATSTPANGTNGLFQNAQSRPPTSDQRLSAQASASLPSTGQAAFRRVDEYELSDYSFYSTDASMDDQHTGGDNADARVHTVSYYPAAGLASDPVLSALASESDITSDNLCSRYRGSVEKHGVVTSLRRDGAYVWCNGFPHLFVNNAQLDRDIDSRSCYDLVPFDVVRVRLIFDANAPRHIRVSQIQRSAENDLTLAEQVMAPLMLARATVERIDPLGKHCMLTRIDDGSSDGIFMNLSAFPFFVKKLSNYLTQGSSVCVAFAEQHAFERFGLSRFFAVAMLPCDTESVTRVWNKTSSARRRLFRDFARGLVPLSSVTKSLRSAPSEIVSAASESTTTASSFRSTGASGQSSFCEFSEPVPSSSFSEPIPTAGFNSSTLATMPPVADAMANFAAGLQRIIRAIGPLGPAEPQMAADIVLAPQAPQLAAYKGLVCVVHPRKIVIFNDALGKVEFDLGGTEAPIFQAYQTVEMVVDIQSLAATGAVTVMSLRVVAMPFTGFENLKFLDALVCENLCEQTAVLRAVANGERILCDRSALPHAMAQQGNFLAVGGRLRALVCANLGAAARPQDCPWQALRLLPGQHSVEVEQVRLLNASLAQEKNPSAEG